MSRSKRNECTVDGCEKRPTKPDDEGRCSKHPEYRRTRYETAKTEHRAERDDQIRQQFLDGASVRELVDEYQLHTNWIRKIVQPVRELRAAREIAEINRLYRRHYTMRDIAEITGIPHARVSESLSDDVLREVEEEKERIKPQLDAIRFFENVVKTDGCWIWTGSLAGRGYPYGGRHRYSYELHRGPIPDDYTIDHLCWVTFCVNPDHMDPITRDENTRRGRRSTEPITRPRSDWSTGVCSRGHDITDPNNIYVSSASGARACQTCRINRINESQNEHRFKMMELREKMLADWEKNNDVVHEAA